MTEPDVDLAQLPAPILQQLLDAFAVQVSDQRHPHCVRISLRASRVLYPDDEHTLNVEFPDSWPQLTSTAARALLRLLTTVAAQRGLPVEESTT
jgi:hypothetical protein